MSDYLGETILFKKINGQEPMYAASAVDNLITGISADYYTKDEIDENFYDKTEIDNKIASVYHFKGSVDTYQELKELAGMAVGDVYNVSESGKNYAWTGETSAYDDGWDVLGGTFDLDNYYTKDETDALLDDKVDVEEGKGLSQNDFTDALKAKLDDIAASAQVNVIEVVKVDGTPLTVDGNKAVDIDLATPLAEKADNTAFAGLSALALVDSNNFDVEELATKYNTLVTALSGIAVELNR